MEQLDNERNDVLKLGPEGLRINFSAFVPPSNMVIMPQLRFADFSVNYAREDEIDKEDELWQS